MRSDFENWVLEAELDWSGEDDFGYSFAVFEFTEEDLAEFRKTSNEAVRLGWYFVEWDAQGFVSTYGGTEDYVRQVWDNCENHYSEWLGEEDAEVLDSGDKRPRVDSSGDTVRWDNEEHGWVSEGDPDMVYDSILTYHREFARVEAFAY